MGWCHEFGPQLSPECGHPMVAGDGECSCSHCGLSCTGRFPGCVAVWSAGPKIVEPRKLDLVKRDAVSRRRRPRAIPEDLGPEPTNKSGNMIKPQPSREDLSSEISGAEELKRLLQVQLQELSGAVEAQAMTVSLLSDQVEGLCELADADKQGSAISQLFYSSNDHGSDEHMSSASADVQIFDGSTNGSSNGNGKAAQNVTSAQRRYA
jgi:uncharacterized Zn finger protein (UPF0148 family)